MAKSFQRKVNGITFFYHENGEGDETKRHITACSEDEALLREACEFFATEGWDVKVAEEESSTPEEPLWMLTGNRLLSEIEADEEKRRKEAEEAQKLHITTEAVETHGKAGVVFPDAPIDVDLSE